MKIIFSRRLVFLVSRPDYGLELSHVALSYKTENDMARKIFHSLDAVMAYFEESKNKDNPNIKELLNLYNDKLKETNFSFTNVNERKYPLITIEGLDGTGKSTLSSMLAKHLEADRFHTPPDNLDKLKVYFNKCEVVERTAFYTLGNYIAAMDLYNLLQKNIVVLDRFWHSTSAYAMAQEIRDHPEIYSLPPEGDDIYNWPKDLLKPDIVFFFTVSEEVRKRRQLGRTKMTMQENMLNTEKEYRENVVNSFLRMKNPSVIEVNGDPEKEEVFQFLLSNVQHVVPSGK